MSPSLRPHLRSSGILPVALAAAGIIAFAAFWVAAATAWVTHVIVCIHASAWVLLLFGCIVFPVGVIHGVGVWFGLFSGL